MKKWKHVPALDHDLSFSESIRSSRRESGLPFRMGHLASWTLLKIYLLLAHRVRVTGRKNLPATGPFVLVANHASHLDTITLAAALPMRLRSKVIPVAAGDLFFKNTRNALLSSIALNALPMWRKAGTAHALRELRERLEPTEAVMILFPEGTRSRDGSMSDFKAGIGMIVAGSKVPVVPCYLDGCFRALPPGRRWPRLTRITLHVGEPVLYEGMEDNRKGWQAVAVDLQQRVDALAGEEIIRR